MKDVRLPKGANITLSRDEYREATGGNGVGWWIAGIIVVAALAGGTQTATNGHKSTPTNTPRPTVTANR